MCILFLLHPSGLSCWLGPVADSALRDHCIARSHIDYTGDEEADRTGDIVRILCWGMVGMFLGRHLFGRGYYDHFYPNYGHVIDSLVSGILIVALLGIVISLFLLPQPKAPPPGSCQTCGYDLQGLTINRCPECGAVFKLPEQNTN